MIRTRAMHVLGSPKLRTNEQPSPTLPHLGETMER